MARCYTGRMLVSGSAEGTALVSQEPISFWGGLNPDTGELVDRRHERSGANVAGRVFVFPRGRGSSTGSAILLDSIKKGNAPAGIVNCQVDSIIALGAIVADEMYGHTIPVVVLPQDAFDSICEGDHVVIKPDGRVLVQPNGEPGI